ncbi:MAG: hypothetical protein ACO1N5_00285 [Noviherbaspirillum sp.]
MKSLTIKDLAVTTELDRKAMAGVHGGHLGRAHLLMPVFAASSETTKLDIAQSIGQSQDVVNMNGNNVAFAGDITSTVKPDQTAKNTIRF